MTNKQRTFLLDLQGFIAHSLAPPHMDNFDLTLQALQHDITKKSLHEYAFRPITRGYSKHLK